MTELYSRTLRLKNDGMISGSFEKDVEVGDNNMPWDSPIIVAFLDDDDIREITIVSTCIGFVKTLTKQHRLYQVKAPITR